MRNDTAIEALDISAFRVPTSSSEADGTFVWSETTIVIVRAAAAGVRSLAYTYADIATAQLIESTLKRVVMGRCAMCVPATWLEMVRAIRNLGRPGICSMAIAAVDCALWDL